MNSTRMKNLPKKIHRLANKKTKPSGNSINQQKTKKRKFYTKHLQKQELLFFFCVMLREIYTQNSFYGKMVHHKRKIKIQKLCASLSFTSNKNN